MDTRTGLFRRDLGRKQGGAQHRFYLGRDRAKATLANQRLDLLWDAVKAYFARYRDGETPVWDDTTLTIAQAVARGEFTCSVDVPAYVRTLAATDGEHVVHGWLNQFRQVFGTVIGIQIADDDLARSAEQAQTRRGEHHRELADGILRTVGRAATGETLYRAIDAYIACLEAKFVTPPEQGEEQRTSQTGKKQGERAARLKAHHKDIPLSDLTEKELDAMIAYWAARPKTEKGGVYSFFTCKHQIRLIKHLIKWLHRSSEFRWRKPADYEFDRVTILRHPHEIAARLTPHQVKTFGRDHLGTLWEYATPLERVFMALALNCGFNISEVATLRTAEVHGDMIKRLRHKSKVYGEWQLWPVTMEAIRWAEARKAHLGIKSDLLLTTEAGRSYIAPTTKNNRGAKIPNAWNRLLTRVQEDHADFPRLSFGKLRKTAGDLIRKFADGEVAAIFLAHGQSVSSDELAENYTNRPFEKVFAAQERVWEYLKDVLTGEFPPQDAKKPSAKVSVGTVKKIQSLWDEGLTADRIAELCDVGITTVRRHTAGRKR